ncbi:MAG: hypothetical protein WBP44_07965 [Gammaproteobacteria bacterium]
MVLSIALSLAACPVWAQENTEAIDVMEEYLDFVDYGGATIFPEQIPALDWNNFFILPYIVSSVAARSRINFP